MDGLIAAHTFGTSSAKGQLISKCLFDVFISSKNEFENHNFCPSLLGQKFFCLFFGRIEKTKKTF